MSEAYTGYITYDEYTEFGGIADASAFPLLERKAHRLIDMWTLNRLVNATTIPDVVKECITEMINQISTWENGSDVTSFSNGKVTMAFDTSKSRESRLFNEVALVYLPVSLISEVVANED